MWRLTCTKDLAGVDLSTCLNHANASLRRASGTLAFCLFASFAPWQLALGQGFVDPLETPAQSYSDALTNLPIQAVARAGENLVAVGMRGVILRSGDAGKHWQQMPAPVSSDLLDVFFVSATHGWAVGQDGVILASSDGGASWRKQFDGRQAFEQFSHYYQSNVGIDAQTRNGFLQQIETNFKAGPVLPFFSVHFIDERNGLAVGPFGTLVVSNDGGEHWRPALEQIDNPDFLHLNAIAQVGDQLFITSEQGVVFEADTGTLHFRRLNTGHQGSFFSIAGHDDVLLAGGLAGVLYASLDRGQTWSALTTPLTQLVTRIAFDPLQRRFTAVTAGGEVLSLSADLRQFAVRKSRAPMLYTDVADLGGAILYTGIQGLRQETGASQQPQKGEQQ